MKTLLLSLICIFCFSNSAFAGNQTQALMESAEMLRLAMINADAAQLKALTAPELSYGHSGGHLENQSEFIEKIVSGKSDFVTIELRNQTFQITKDIAIVRHNLVGTTNDSGKPGVVDLGVMQVWQKQHNQWKLLARQAFKPH